MAQGRKNEHGLTPAQEVFCLEYHKRGIASDAFKIAYPASLKWKDTSLYPRASELLNNSKVKARLAALNAEAVQSVQKNVVLNKTKILEEIVRQYTETAQNGASERTNSVALLKLMSQISKLIGENGTNVTVNVQNNTVVGEVSDYLGL